MLLDRLSSANCLQAFLWASFRRGLLLGWWPCKPTCCSVCRMVWALTSWPSNSATSKAMLAALMHPFIEASFCTWCTIQGLNCCNRGVNTILSTQIVFPSLLPQFGSAFFVSIWFDLYQSWTNQCFWTNWLCEWLLYSLIRTITCFFSDWITIFKWIGWVKD